MLGNNPSAYFSNYVECLQTIPMLIQEHVSCSLHSNTVQNRILMSMEESISKFHDPSNIDKTVSDMVSSLRVLNEIYDAKISDINDLEENLEKTSQNMLNSKTAVLADDAQQLRSLINTFRTDGWNTRRNAASMSQNSSKELYDNMPGRDASHGLRRSSNFGGTNKKDVAAAVQKQRKQQRLRRTSSDILLRGTKWINAGKRRRILDSDMQRRPQSATKKSQLKSIRDQHTKYRSNVLVPCQSSSAYILNQRGGRNNVASPTTTVSHMGICHQSKRRIGDQNRQSLLVSRHSLKLSDPQKTSRYSSDDLRAKRGVPSTFIQKNTMCESASDLDAYDSEVGTMSKTVPARKRDRYAYSESTKDESGRLYECLLPEDSIESGHHANPDDSSNESSLSTNEDHASMGSRVSSPSVNKQLIYSGMGRHRLPTSPVFSYGQSRRKIKNSPDPSKSSDSPRSQATVYPVSKRGSRILSSNKNFAPSSTTRSPLSQSPNSKLRPLDANEAGGCASEDDDADGYKNDPKLEVCGGAVEEEDGSTESDENAIAGSGERVYCLCKKVSFGQMIACDNKRCPIEWFHFGCVDIRVQPKGKWYCPQCRGDNHKSKRLDA